MDSRASHHQQPSAFQQEIFVSGFSRHTTTAQVEAYFSGFGWARVRKYNSYFKQQGIDAPFKGGEGYFILYDMEPTTYQQILDGCPHLVRHRCLDVCPLKTGWDLILYNAVKNKRRVLVKKVPSSVADMHLLNLLVQRYGPVERFFAHKSDASTKAPNRSKRTYITYSVTFQAGTSAAKAYSEGCLLVETDMEQVTVTIEKFKRTGAAFQESRQATINNRALNMQACRSANLQARDLVENPAMRDRQSSAIGKSPSIPIHGLASEIAIRRLHLRGEPSGDGGVTTDSVDVIAHWTSYEYHHIKPTSIRYNRTDSDEQSSGNLEFRWESTCTTMLLTEAKVEYIAKSTVLRYPRYREPVSGRNHLIPGTSGVVSN